MSIKDDNLRGSAEIVPNRYVEERAYETREVYEKRIMQMSTKTPLDIPVHEVPDGKNYLWVRSSIYGEPDTANMAQMEYFGWQIVPASRHAKYITKDPLNREQHLNGCLHYKGLVLHERDKELCDLEEKQRHVDSLGQIKRTKGLERAAELQERNYKKHFSYNPFAEMNY